MIMEKFPTMAPWQQWSFIGFSIVLAAGAGLCLSAYVVAWGLGLSIQMPDDLLFWPSMALSDYSDSETNKWVQIGGYAGIAPALLIALAFLVSRPTVDVHGKAKFAEKRDIKKMGLRAKEGLVCGFTGPLPSRNYGKPVNRYGTEVEDGGTVKVADKGRLTNGNLLTYGGPEHMILYAPTRSGKGVGVVIPNLLNWPDSAVVLDIKKENWTKTAGFRAANGQDVFMFDPLEPQSRTHRWNPLASVRRGTEMQVDDLQRLAALFIPMSDKDPFFDLSARNAFVGVGGYLAETTELPFTLGEIYRQLTLSADFVKTFRKRIKDREENGEPLSIQTVSVLNDFMSKSENTFEGVKGSITSHLGLYVNPLVDRATSASDFDFADLRKKRMTIYVGITPNNISRLSPLFNLFFQSCVDANMQELPEHNPALKYKVLMCMDEFAAAGKMQSFKDGIAFFAGYGLKVLTILQSPSQLSDIYGRDAADVYMANAGVEIVYTPKLQKDAKELSEALGTRGVDSMSETKQKHFAQRKGASVNISQARRDLMMPQELRAMDQSKEIILVAGHPPVLANKLRYYAEAAFLERSRIPPPQISSLKPGEVKAEIETMKAENTKLRADLEALKVHFDPLSALANFRDENVANGEAAEIEMTDEEIQDPSKITLERLHLQKSSARDKIGELKRSDRLNTQDGQRELLAAFAIDVDPDAQMRTNP
ncbi:type IV secretory system conjugative DNA transfer family protein [Parasulfitobacter algicola]|uniref:Type IV secretory system conjugative DNA transfer family protein n=1 Tax=Parasulfitobacter algicola TaxID=2614809 RepID=A0ABX2IV56_9RHOB|nr:type IV secretory system conjugative DNA transfer family protein [Sulfitobacter algicola]NSX56802.1 type IV secretory system conjugative DNA transfer family protein [Sulfitobacter algicola]